MNISITISSKVFHAVCIPCISFIRADGHVGYDRIRFRSYCYIKYCIRCTVETLIMNISITISSKVFHAVCIPCISFIRADGHVGYDRIRFRSYCYIKYSICGTVSTFVVNSSITISPKVFHAVCIPCISFIRADGHVGYDRIRFRSYCYIKYSICGTVSTFVVNSSITISPKVFHAVCIPCISFIRADGHVGYQWIGIIID